MTKEAKEMATRPRDDKETKMSKNDERLKREIADAVRTFGREQMELAAKSVSVKLRPGELLVRLDGALPSATRGLAATPAGRRVLRLYKAAFDAVKKALEIEVSRKVGLPVQESEFRAVLKSGHSMFRFALGAGPGGSGTWRRPP
jgi:uncharacterized protein YbcI